MRIRDRRQSVAGRESIREGFVQRGFANALFLIRITLMCFHPCVHDVLLLMGCCRAARIAESMLVPPLCFLNGLSAVCQLVAIRVLDRLSASKRTLVQYHAGGARKHPTAGYPRS